MINSKYIGISATILSFISVFPQLIHVHKTKNVSSLTLTSEVLALLGSLLWLIFYITQKDSISALSSTANIIFISYFIYEIFMQKTNKASLLTK